MDVHAVLTRASSAGRVADGVRIRDRHARGRRIEVRDGPGRAACCSRTARRMDTERVVLAAGAWAAAARRARPARRSRSRRCAATWCSWAGARMPRWKRPVVWRIDDVPSTFAPSPAAAGQPVRRDARAGAGHPQRSTVDPARMHAARQQAAKALAARPGQSAEVRRRDGSVCAPTTRKSRELASGPIRACRGLYWLAGLGGRGMTCGIGGGQSCSARTVVGLPTRCMRIAPRAGLVKPATAVTIDADRAANVGITALRPCTRSQANPLRAPCWSTCRAWSRRTTRARPIRARRDRARRLRHLGPPRLVADAQLQRGAHRSRSRRPCATTGASAASTARCFWASTRTRSASPRSRVRSRCWPPTA